MPRTISCEYCARPIPIDEWTFLSENESYNDDGVFIVEHSCVRPDTDMILETYGSLALVLDTQYHKYPSDNN